jgi:SAM-dependent methyltransferase
MTDARQQGDDVQGALWNGAAGRGWVEAQKLIDPMFRSFEELLVQTVAAGAGGRVLDVGCGMGATTLAVARLPGVQGRCTGIDISQPMIAVARTRAEREGSPARFILADAQSYAFEPGAYDLIISRFGVMFFDDPVRAFANLRRASREGAALRLLAWRGAEENPFMTTAERAAAPLLPDLPVRRPDEPGQFAFADPRRVASILEESGWTGIEILPVDAACTLPESELIQYLTRLGPVGRTLVDADQQTRAHVLDIVRSAFDPYIHGEQVRFTAACWMIAARTQA